MPDISEEQIKVFVDAVSRFFTQISQEAALVRGAYLGDADGQPMSFDFTGRIRISGQYRGEITLSAPRAMIRHLLVAMREPNQSDENLLDTVGEIANTIAGNARKHFGETMEISVPQTYAGPAPALARMVRARPYVIMVSWKRYDAALVVDVERRD